MTPAVEALLVLAGAVVLFVWNRVSVGVVAILVALVLLALGLVDSTTALAGFGDPVVVFIATLFVVSAGLEHSGLTAWAGRTLTDKAGTRRTPLLLAVMALSAVLSALVTPNGGVAALLPVTMAAARRARLRPSALLMPVAFAASAGALLVLSGSPVNVLVSSMARDETGAPFGFFEFALVGVPLVLGTVVVAILGGSLLPARDSGDTQADLSGHLGVLADHFELGEGVFRVLVPHPVPTMVNEVRAAGLVRLVGIQGANGDGRQVGRGPVAGDTMVVSGPSDEVWRMVGRYGLTVTAKPPTRDQLLDDRVGLAEVVVAPRSSAIGETFFPGLRRGDVLVLGVRRLGRSRQEQTTDLIEGDALLVHGTWTAMQRLEHDDDVLVVDSPDQVRRQLAPLGSAALKAGLILVGMIVLLATGVVLPAVAGLIAAAAMVVLKVITVPQAYRAVSWQTVVLIGGLIPLSVAIQDSGAADLLASGLVDVVGQAHPLVLLLALFVLTAALGQVISNVATSLVVLPIALAVAAESGLDARTVLMSIAVAAGASMLTPIATPANMMVMSPGGYRFGDYRRLGGVTMLVWLAVSVLVVPLIWGL